MYLYSMWIRLWHLLNAIFVILLILTGTSIRYPGDDMHFIFVTSKAVRIHNVTSVLLIANYIFFVTGNFLSENGKYYLLKRKSFWSGMGKQFRYYAYGIFRGEKNPFPVSLEQKFNPLQRFTYVIVMYFAMPLVIISGLGLLFTGSDTKELSGENMYFIHKAIHVITAIVLTFFLIVHIYICTIGSGSTSLLRGIISGFVQSEES